MIFKDFSVGMGVGMVGAERLTEAVRAAGNDRRRGFCRDYRLGRVAGGLADGADDVVEVVDDEQLDGAVGQVEPQAGAHAAGEGVAVGRLAADAGDATEGGLPAGAAGEGVEPVGLEDQALLGEVEPPPDGAASGLSPVGGTIPDNGLGLA